MVQGEGGCRRFNRAGCFFGHGFVDAWDEAVYLVLHTLALPLDRLEPFLDACIPGDEREALFEVIEQRAVDRLPAAYHEIPTLSQSTYDACKAWADANARLTAAQKG